MHKKLSHEALRIVAERFRILSEPIRLNILQHLQDGERSVSELSELLAAGQPNMSKHLKILQEAGIVLRRREGNTVFYSIADESTFELCQLVCGSLEARFRNQAEIFA